MKNQYQIEIKECCASCKHKVCLSNGTRVCQKMGLKVDRKYKCRKWEMSDGLKNAGKSGGVVKDKETKEVVIR